MNIPAPVAKFDKNGHLWIPVEHIGIPEGAKVDSYTILVGDGGFGLAVTYIDLTQYVLSIKEG
jgi:hypothetical protein